MSPDRNILLYPYLTLQTSLKSFRYKATVEPSPLSNRSLSPRNTVYAATPTTVKLTSNSVAAVTVLCSSTSHDFTTTFSNHMVRNVSYLSIASHLPSSTPNPPRLYLSCSFASSPPLSQYLPCWTFIHPHPSNSSTLHPTRNSSGALFIMPLSPPPVRVGHSPLSLHITISKTYPVSTSPKSRHH